MEHTKRRWESLRVLAEETRSNKTFEELAPHVKPGKNLMKILDKCIEEVEMLIFFSDPEEIVAWIVTETAAQSQLHDEVLKEIAEAKCGLAEKRVLTVAFLSLYI